MARFMRLTDAIFDVGGVLYTLDYDRMWKHFSQVSGKPIEMITHILYQEATFNDFEKGKISSIEYYKAVIDDLECSLSFYAFKKLFNSFLIKRTGIFDLLSKLKKKITIHFLSNTNEINAEVLKNDLERISSSITYSFLTGYKKPEHEIFRIALDKAKADPKEILFIDDSEENISAAREVGLYTYLFESNEGLLKTLEQFGISLQ